MSNQRSKDVKTFDFHSEPGFYLFTSPDHYRVYNNVMTKTKAERLSDAVVFQHNKINPPKPTNATLVIKALASFLESIKGVTKGFRKAALKNSVNMKDIVPCRAHKQHDVKAARGSRQASTGLTAADSADRRY